MQLQPHTLFHNHYTLISLIGRGGFSEVWLAKDKYTDLDIALKIYAPNGGLGEDGIKIFSSEIKCVYNLNHPNLLKPQHFDVCDGMPYLVIPFCAKGSVTKRIGRATESEIWGILHDIAAGLAYLHSKDIVHQDIKPDNILQDADGHYLITDFGISAKARTTLRKSMLGASTSGGTMAYMGPERFSAQPAPTKASDIWSLGAMIYELITGDVPFGEIGGGMQKNGAEIPDIAQPISPALTQVIHLMLAKETWNRPIAETLVTWAADPSLVKSIEPPHVSRSPRIISFSAASQISKGQQCTIFWNTENVKHVVVNGNAYPANYTLSLSLNSTTTIQLVFIGEDGTTLEREVTVRVIQTPPASKPREKRNWPWTTLIIAIMITIALIFGLVGLLQRTHSHQEQMVSGTNSIANEQITTETNMNRDASIESSYLSVSNTNLHFGYISRTDTLEVYSNTTWQLNYTQSNIFTIVRNGSQLIVQCSTNTTYNARKDWFEITTTDGVKTIRINITQDGAKRDEKRTTTKTLTVDSKILRTDYHLWKVLKIKLTPDNTILYERVTPRISGTYVYCDSSEYIEDADTGKKYYITHSGIGMVNNPTILTSDDPYEYTCTYPVIPESVRAINIWSGNQYYIKNFIINR